METTERSRGAGYHRFDMTRPSLALLHICTVSVALTLGAVESHAAAKKPGVTKTGVKPVKRRPQARPTSSAANLPKTPVKPASKKPVNTSNEVSTSATTPTSSLVKGAPAAGRRWITPVIRNESKFLPGDHIAHEYQYMGTIQVINPDTKATMRLQLVCYDRDGKRKGTRTQETVQPMAVAFLYTPAKGDVWCHLSTSIPSLAYLSLSQFRRRGGQKGDFNVEELVIPLFKVQD